jgi:hypothetical protein
VIVRIRAALLAVLAALVGLAAVVVAAGPAFAHNVLLQTEPADRSTVAAVPARVTLVFDKPALALGTTIEVQGPHGPEAVGHAVLLNATVSENIRAGAPAGAYVVRWRVTSADGHPISGSFAFTARAAGGGTLTVAPPNPSPPTTTGSSGSILLGWGLIWLAFVTAIVALVARRRPARRKEAEPDG